MGGMTHTEVFWILRHVEVYQLVDSLLPKQKVRGFEPRLRLKSSLKCACGGTVDSTALEKTECIPQDVVKRDR